MSWRDVSSSNTNGVQDGSGGSMSGSGSVSGTGGGGWGGQGGVTTGGRGGYTFSGVPGSRNIGNWNTGGPMVGFGSLGGGIQGFTPRDQMGIPTPVSGPPVRPPMPPFMPPPVPPQYPPSYPPSRPDLNPATLAPWTGVGLDPLAGFRNPNGNYPAQYNGGGPGNSFNNGYGNVGGGRGGGGGGGW